MRNNQRQAILKGLPFLLLGLCFLLTLPVYAKEAESDEKATQQQSSYSNISTKVTKKNQDFSVDTACGIDGFVVYDNPVVIDVTVKSQQDFTGTIRVIPTMEEGQKTIAYAEEISLAGGGTKTFHFTVANLGGTGKFDVQLLDEKDKVVYAETDRVPSISTAGSSVVTGILSDDYAALNYFDGVPVLVSDYQGMVSTLQLTEDNFPDNNSALSVLNYIVIDNFDTAKLSDEQYRALKQWVKNGGVLILSLGANYQNVLHAFTDDFVSGTLGTLTKKDLQWGTFEVQSEQKDNVQGNEQALEGTAGAGNEPNPKDSAEQNNEPDADSKQNNVQPDLPELENVDCIEFELDGGEELDVLSKQHSAYKKKTGAGSVIVLSYALGMEPFTSFDARKDIAACLVSAASGERTADILKGDYTYYGNTLGGGAGIAKTLNETKKPSALLFGIVLIVYVILVGPVLYLILKKKKTREKIWFSVPLMALVFTGVIYVIGMMYRVRKPMVDTFTILKVDGDTKKENIFVNVTCPKAKQYSVMLNDDYSDISYDPYIYYDYNIFDTSSKKNTFDYMFCKVNGGLELTMNNATAFHSTDFTIEKLTDNDVGQVDLDLHCYTDGFEGTITNNTIYDLEGVVVTFENYYYQAGDIKKGETVSVDPEKMITGFSYGVFESIYTKRKDLYSNRKLYKQYQLDSFMEGSYAHSMTYGEGLVWGQIGSYVPELTEDKSVKASGQAVYMAQFHSDYEDVAGSYCPDIRQLQVSGSGTYDTTDGQMYQNEMDLTYSFENYPDIKELVNLTYGDEPYNGNSGQYARVYAYNIVTGAFDEIFTDSDTLGGEQLKQYLDGDVLILRFESDSADYYSTYMPRIAARGDE